MILPSFFFFILALGAAYAVPGWHVGFHFFPYTFLLALLVTQGIDRTMMIAGTVYAVMFELFLGLSLGTLSLPFVGAGVLFALAGRMITLKPLVSEKSITAWCASLLAGALLWAVMLAESWIIQRLIYPSAQYPFGTLVAILSDPGSIATMLGEYAIAVLFMWFVYRRTISAHGTFS